MAKEMMQSSQKRGGSVLDPRTKMLLVVTSASVLIGGGSDGAMNVIKPVLTAVPLLLFLCSGKWKAAVIYTTVYIFAFAGEKLLVPVTTGFVNFIVVACCGMFSRFMPGIAMGSYLVNTTTVSEFMAAMERMKLPQKLSIPLSVMFRFFPTVVEEYGAIGDAMRMRGIRFGGGKPAKMLEYRMVPLMISCVKIGEELSAAALTRGLGAPIGRTNICKIGFKGYDAAAMLICAVGVIALLFEKVT
ncbi:energy-coupling factor transporter transmembrane component T [Kineothrix sedimenti]|uniref:Energy-coupling factor transporter transmembrane component T n=1 Tax=Kineothrix sedimenti TaxID=3123317 RepID=A0ABZ3F260_9FIRM